MCYSIYKFNTSYELQIGKSASEHGVVNVVRVTCRELELSQIPKCCGTI